MYICNTSTAAQIQPLRRTYSEPKVPRSFRVVSPNPKPSTSGASTRAAKAFEAFKRGKSAAIASPGEVRFQEPMFCEKTLEESSHKINLKRDKSHENYSYLMLFVYHKP
jgi:hypothetical protein